LNKHPKKRLLSSVTAHQLKNVLVSTLLVINMLLTGVLVYEYVWIQKKSTHLDLIREDYEDYCSHLERFIHEYEESQEGNDSLHSSCLDDDFLPLNREADYRQKNMFLTDEESPEEGIEIADKNTEQVTIAKTEVKRPLLRVPLPRKRYTHQKQLFEWPIDQDSFWISSYYGRRSRNRFHKGIDLAAPKGTPVKAAADGTIEYAGWAGTFGTMVLIRHHSPTKGYKTRYAHLHKSKILVGERVNKGHIIGFVGNTGRVSGKNGYHLHFEVLHNGTALNPMLVL
jgi:murein DD-endopeptidase MepM/ murein hydrolase activator NlpD